MTVMASRYAALAAVAMATAGAARAENALMTELNKVIFMNNVRALFAPPLDLAQPRRATATSCSA